MANGTITPELLDKAFAQSERMATRPTFFVVGAGAFEVLSLTKRASDGDEGARVELLKRDIRGRITRYARVSRPNLP